MRGRRITLVHLLQKTEPLLRPRPRPQPRPRPRSAAAPGRAAIKTWTACTAVCFDVDSTVCEDEAIDR